MRRLVGFLVGCVILAGVVLVGYRVYTRRQHVVPQYLTAAVEQGHIATTVNATGTLNAVVSVQVGSQVSGRITKILVDYNSVVTARQVIAQIDAAPFEARVSQGRASVDNTRAEVRVAQANLENTQAAIETAKADVASAWAAVEKAQITIVDARRTLERQKALKERLIVAERDLDAAQTVFDAAVSEHQAALARHQAAQSRVDAAQAQKRLAEAQITAVKAQVAQSVAVLQAAELDLANTTIRSPVNGVVIARDIDVGQTVAASLQAPVLFRIAQDLTSMQIDTNVSEADIGKVREHQKATFTVDAYPERTFVGTVTQVRHAPITVQNVVTYNAVVAVENSDLRLKPGMTANVTFIIAERDNVLKVPNAALRFQPEGATPERLVPVEREGQWAVLFQQRLTQELDLSQEQQDRLRRILDPMRQQGQQLRQSDLSDAERLQQRQARRDNIRIQIRQILSVAQQGRFDELVKRVEQRRETGAFASRPGRVWIVGADGAPQPLTLQLGITDDSRTEVLAGEVHAGQEVITGLQTPSQTPARTFTPGFGLRRL